MSGWMGNKHTKPSVIMLQVLEGKLHHDDAPEAVQSMILLEYHKAAVEILDLPENKMKKALAKVPSTCYEQVRKRMLELWRIRK